MSNTKNIIICDSAIPFAIPAFSQYGETRLIHSYSINKQSLSSANILVVRSVTKVNHELLHGSNIKLVCTATTGDDHIDKDYLEKNGIAFVSADGANSKAVADYIYHALQFLSTNYSFELQNKILGIIGVGKIGLLVQRLANRLNLRVFGYDPPRELRDKNFVSSSLEDIYKCDIITIHVPLVVSGEHKTKNLINKFFFNNLKDEAIIINSSRGEVLNSNDLTNAIKKKNIHAVLDVWAEEPYYNKPLFEQCRLITPHIAGYSLEAKLFATKLVSMHIAEHLQINCEFNHNKFLPPIPVDYSYDIYKDNLITTNFKLIENKTEQSLFFENFRKNYQLRRELYNIFFQTDNDTQAR